MTHGADPEAFMAFEAAGWEQRAETYGDLVGRITERFAERLLDAAAVGAETRLVDLGTGHGRVAGRGAQRGAAVVGIDISEAMLRKSRARYPGLDFRQGDAENLPLADASFDAAVGSFLLLHLARPERAAAEIHRILAPGGRVALTVWDEPSRSRLLGILLDALAEAEASPPADLPEGPPIFLFAAEERFVALLAGAGFEQVEVETVVFDEAVGDADELWNGLMSGTVRLSPVVRGQSEDVRRRIRASFERLLEEHRVGEGFEVPVSVKLASARKAA